MKARKSMPRTMSGDKLEMGEYALIVSPDNHANRVVTPQQQFSRDYPTRLVMLTHGYTNIGDAFTQPRFITIQRISNRQAFKLIAESKKIVEIKRKRKETFSEC